jgi:dihydroorotate dehydrogenase (fumarate)
MDTTTSYLGLRLPHPFIAGASPLGLSLDKIKRLEDAGCAAVVLPSLFEEQITLEEQGRVAGVNIDDPTFADVFGQFPQPNEYAIHRDEYAEHVRRVKAAVSMPVIGSLNGRTRQSWLEYARAIEEAGADALELNMYEVVTDLAVPSVHVEAELVGVVQTVKEIVTIPVAVKLSPFFTAIGDIARRLADADADGLVLFNRFYQPDIDINSLSVTARADLSTSAELLLRLRWLAILHGRVNVSMAVSGGVATPVDAIKAVLAGADAVQLVSALLRHGPAYLLTMRTELENWLSHHDAASIHEVKGMLSLQRQRDASSYERAQYIRTLQSWSKPR